MIIDAASQHRHRIETPDAVGCIASTATMRYDDDVGSPAPMLVASDITHRPEYGIDAKSLLTSPLREDEQLGNCESSVANVLVIEQRGVVDLSIHGVGFL